MRIEIARSPTSYEFEPFRPTLLRAQFAAPEKIAFRHTEAAKHHEAGHHEKAAHHAHTARAHAIQAREHAEEAVKAYLGVLG